jgi:hypothetical protein
MNRAISLSALAAMSVACLCVGTALSPVAAGGQAEVPVERGLVLVITSTKPRELSKVHWGIYRTADYSYPKGKLVSTPARERIVEEDMSVGQGFNRAGLKLKTGEYEVHLMPEKGRPTVEKFIVNNLATTAIGLNFTVSPLTDPDERNKTELIGLGPSLSDLQARLEALEKKAGISPTR